MEFTNKDLALKIAKALDEKKAEDIQVLDVLELTSLAEYFVICNGTSSTQVKALSDEVQEQMTKIGIEPHHIEGERGGNWVLLDYDGVIVHIFYRETREFYKLDKLWNDAEKVDFLVNNSPKESE